MINRLFSAIFILVVLAVLAVGYSVMTHMEPPWPVSADTTLRDPQASPAEDNRIIVTGNDAPIKLVTGEYAPFTGEKLPNGGVTTEIVTAVFNELGWKYEISFEPWARGVENLDVGKYFGTFPYYKDEKRAETYLFSDPIISDDFVFYVMADSTLDYKTPEDLTGRTICYPGGAGWSLVGLQPLLDAGKIKMERPSSQTACFNMLQAKRVDMVFSARSAGLPAAMQAFGSTDGVKVLPQPFAPAAASLMIRKSYPEGQQILDNFNKALKKLEDNGTLAAIRARHQQD